MVGGAAPGRVAHQRGLPPPAPGPDLRRPRHPGARGGLPRRRRRRSRSSARRSTRSALVAGAASSLPRIEDDGTIAARSGGSTGSATASSTSTPPSSQRSASTSGGSVELRFGGQARMARWVADLRRRQAVRARAARRLLRAAVARARPPVRGRGACSCAPGSAVTVVAPGDVESDALAVPARSSRPMTCRAHAARECGRAPRDDHRASRSCSC